MQDIFDLWQRLIEQNPEYRVGQALFLAIADLHPDLSDRLQKDENAKACDPFYDDTKVGAAIGWLYAKEAR